jgi:hypothetical protein
VDCDLYQYENKVEIIKGIYSLNCLGENNLGDVQKSLIFVLFGCLPRSLGPQVFPSYINNYVWHIVQFVQVAHRSWVLLDMLEQYCKHGQF